MDDQMTLSGVKSPPPEFDGATYEAEKDHARLSGQLQAVFDLMRDGEWRTLDEIGIGVFAWSGVMATTQGLSARVRDLRKAKFGGHTVNRRRVVSRPAGLYEYQLIVRKGERDV